MSRSKLSVLSPGRRAIFLAVVFASGTLALAYQVIWIRMFYPVTGMHLYAIAAVVATFMGGLGLGSALFGRIVDRVNPWKLYAWLEIGVGASALVIPVLIPFVGRAYAFLIPLGTPAVFSHVFRFAAITILLSVPCLLIGGTFPAFAKAYARSSARLGRDLGGLYALNTGGGAFGCVLAGLVFLPSLGMSEITLLCAGGNLLLGAGVLLLSPFLPPTEPDSDPSRSADLGTPVAGAGRIVLLIVFLTGFLSLSYEILWTRALTQIIHSTYASLTMILAAMLLGMTLGSWLYRTALADREWGSLLPVLTSLLLCATVGSFLVVFRLVDLMLYLQSATAIQSAELAKLAASFLVCLIAFFPSAFLFGAIFPLCLRLYAKVTGRLGEKIGRAYAINTAGSVAGVLLTGLVMIGQLGSGITLQGLLVLNAVLIALSLRAQPITRVSTRYARVLAGFVLTGVSAALVFSFPTDLFFANQLAAVSRRIPGPKRILFRGEDAASLAIVVEEEQQPFRFARGREIVEGRHRETYHSNWRGTGGIVGGTRIYLWNVASAYLGALLHPDPKSVLIIGYGSGRQTIALAGFQEPTKIDVVEVNGLNFAASEYFYLDPEFLQTDPRIAVFIDDGRNHLLRSNTLYDLILVDVGGLFSDGSEFFYTREFLDLCRNHLKPGGYLFTWLDMRKLLGPLGWMVQNTFRDVFPGSSVWLGTKEATSFQWLWLVGANGELAVDYALLRQRWDALTPGQRLEVGLTGIRSPEDLLSLFVAGLDDELPERIGRARLLTDDRPFYAKAWEPDPVDIKQWFAPVLSQDHDYYEAGFGHILGGRSLPPLRNVSSAESLALAENRDLHFRKVRQTTTAVLARYLAEELGAERLSEGLLQEYLDTVPTSDGDRNPVAEAVRQVLSRGASRARVAPTTQR